MSFLKSRWFSFLVNQETKVILYLVLICLMGTSYLGYLVPNIISSLFKTYDQMDLFYESIRNLALLLVGEYVVRFLYQVLVNKYVQLLIQNARMRCYNTWIRNSEGKKVNDEFPLGEILARIINDTESIRELLTSGSFGIFIDFFFIVSCLIGFLKIHLVSGIFIFIAEVLICILLIWGSRYMTKIFVLLRKSNGIVSRTLADISGGMNQVYYMDHKNYSQKRMLPALDDFLKYQLQANLWDAGYFSIAESLFPVLLCFLALISPIAQLRELFLIAAIIDLIQRSIAPIKDIAGKISSIQRAATGISRITDFVDKLSSGTVFKTDSVSEFQNLEKLEVIVPEFSYPMRFASDETSTTFTLKNIRVTATKGELIGIVGLSGSGKSTLMKILSLEIIPKNFHYNITYDQNKKVSITETNEAKLDQYKKLVSLISQDSHLFTASLVFNLTLENENTTDLKNFWAKMRKEIDYLKKWGDDLEQMINPKELSLGEKQLLSGLRAVYKSRPIALFDEISSSLDSDLEESLRKVILLVQEKSMTFLVAHRVETLINANKIIVMDKGEMRAEGRHQDLIASNAIYQQFIEQLLSHQ